MICRLNRERILNSGCRTLSLCALIFITHSAFAQTQTTGRIVGIVKDQKGYRITAASVTITNSATAQERKVTTDDQGAYSVPLLAPGLYVVRITGPGFAPAAFESV